MLGQEGSEMINFIAFTPKRRSLWLLNFGVYSTLKRLFDILLSIMGLILLSPLFLIVAILIKREDGGKIFFRQTRTGQFGQEFKILKFRSMVEDNDVRDNSCADCHTKIGKFIRDRSIDELPQLINILKGEMSFIGPRPWIPEYWQAMMKTQRARTLVKPGITGLAQANGRNGISIFEKIRLDVEYVRKFSILMDFYVIFKTVKAVLSKANADAGKQVIHDELAELRADNKRFVEG
jgi:lipopolysaccharide/colanic/teichoic acid biosynthesis glycosyltransferase